MPRPQSGFSVGHVRPLLCLGQGRLRRCGFRAARVDRRSLHRCRWRPRTSAKRRPCVAAMTAGHSRCARCLLVSKFSGSLWFKGFRYSSDLAVCHAHGLSFFEPRQVGKVQRCDLEWIRAGRIQVAESETKLRRGSLHCTRWGGETLSLVAAGRMIGCLAVSDGICLRVRRERERSESA